MFISKSRYVSGCQCPKILWMNEYLPEQFDESVMNDAILESGNEVGDLAMGYFGDFVEIPYMRGRYDEMARMTQELLESDMPNIAEATFMKDGCFCMVDILRVEPDQAAGRPKRVHIVEVKSSTKVKDYHLIDSSFQLWLLEECGLKVESVSIMHMDRSYVRNGELDVRSLFKLVDVTEEARALSAEVPRMLHEFGYLLENPVEPDIPIGLQCDSPFECGYRQWCWKTVPKPNVHDISRLSATKAWDFHDRGIVSFDDIISALDSGEAKLNQKQTNQIKAYLGEIGDVVDQKGIRDFLNTLSYPLYYLDFETIMPAVPPYDGLHPYDQLPTQYSLHWEESPDGPFHHAEFLADPDDDPRRAIAERLCEDIPADACVLAYNMSFEKQRIEELAERFPDLREHLLAICFNIKDLIVPFRNGTYYTKEMQGSSSIKHVLPALFPNDPELDYRLLDGVRNGGDAMAAYSKLAELEQDDPSAADALRESLLRYCELDTYAMVKIVHRLREVAQ